MNDIPSVASQRRWAEGVVSGLDQEATSTPVVFQVSPYTTFYRTNDPEGWVDARAHNNLNIIVNPVGQDCDFVVEAKRTSNDPSTQTLVASVTVTAGATAQIYAGSLDYIAFFRVLQDGTAGGTINASFMMK